LLFSLFFQAEDGIRDYHVTGVQTCALPISEYLSDFKTDGEGGHLAAGALLCLIQKPRPSVRWCPCLVSQPPHQARVLPFKSHKQTVLIPQVLVRLVLGNLGVESNVSG